MKSFSAAAMAAIQRGDAIVAGAVEIMSDPPVRVWGGYGILSIDGNNYDPIGDRGLAQEGSAAIGSAAGNITLTLSGIEPDVIALLNAGEVIRAPVTIWRLIFDGTGTALLDAQIFERGQVDRITVSETIGGVASIQVAVETAARGLGRKGGRMRTDADQRLIKANDGFFKNVAFAAEKTLYWGGKRPANAGRALGGGTPSGGAPRENFNVDLF